MAIDPKELRIGSHVNIKDVRVQVVDINQDVLYYRGISKLDNELKTLGTYPTDENINPIPITEELLTELGFELNEDWNKCLRGSKRLENLDGFIQFKKLSSEFDNLWEMIVGVENGRYQLTQCLFVHYIHEAEQFLYLTTKQELIND